MNMFKTPKFGSMKNHQVKDQAKTGYKEVTTAGASKSIRKKPSFYKTPKNKDLSKAVKNKDKGRLLG